MIGFIIDVSYPDFQKHGVRDKEVIDCVEQHGGRLCNRHHAVRGPASTNVRVIRAFFESEIASVGFVQDMREACIDVDTQVIGLYVEPEPLNVEPAKRATVPCCICGKPCFNGTCFNCDTIQTYLA